MHTNPHLETLPDFPFDKLRNLLEGIDPPAGLDPISLAIGEPQQPVPGWVGTIIADNGHLWNKYPPFAGSDDLRNAIAGFQKALSERPEDGPSSFYIDRCKFYMKTPPPNDWDGVWTDRRK